jgi:hypothetical protein
VSRAKATGSAFSLGSLNRYHAIQRTGDGHLRNVSRLRSHVSRPRNLSICSYCEVVLCNVTTPITNSQLILSSSPSEGLKEHRGRTYSPARTHSPTRCVVILRGGESSLPVALFTRTRQMIRLHSLRIGGPRVIPSATERSSSLVSTTPSNTCLTASASLVPKTKKRVSHHREVRRLTQKPRGYPPAFTRACASAHCSECARRSSRKDATAA